VTTPRRTWLFGIAGALGACRITEADLLAWLPDKRPAQEGDTGDGPADDGGPQTSDVDGDGVAAARDCDDGDPGVGDRALDQDCDGVATADDCDDLDAVLGARSSDQDCDGVPSAGDCDDFDPVSNVRADDGDCDGARSADDCDDRDGSLGVRELDQDCDGVPTGEDCDDEDAELLGEADDADCDGFPADVDCDEADPLSLDRSQDADCDGVPTVEDCDDSDPLLRYLAADRDCDGVPTVDDCDDANPALGAGAQGSVITYAGIEFVVVCAQSFDMGCTSGQVNCESDEYPVMPVTLTRAFLVSKTEITELQWEAYFWGSSATHRPRYEASWHDAAAFADQLSSLMGLPSCYGCTVSGTSVSCGAPPDPYACEGFRLLTEAEWEAAARCGEDYPWAGGSDPAFVAWGGLNSAGTHPTVGTLAPNACGIHDMSGCASEWVNDWYDPAHYTTSAQVDPAGPASGTMRVHRSGSVISQWDYLRTSHRSGLEPDRRWWGWGIRIGRTAP
jgi:formylglycine-generating enzyme required for sulfatase activity